MFSAEKKRLNMDFYCPFTPFDRLTVQTSPFPIRAATRLPIIGRTGGLRQNRLSETAASCGRQPLQASRRMAAKQCRCIKLYRLQAGHSGRAVCTTSLGQVTCHRQFPSGSRRFAIVPTAAGPWWTPFRGNRPLCVGQRLP